MEILALDVGAARVGIARGSQAARLAQPLKTVQTAGAMQELQKLIAQNKVEAIVVGLPRDLSAHETDQTRWVRNWVKEAKAKIDLPFYWQDEALTSKEAAGKNRRSKIKNQGLDALAAAIILQDFLDTPQEQRIVC